MVESSEYAERRDTSVTVDSVDEDGAPEVNVGVLVAHSSGVEAGRLQNFAREVVDRAQETLERATGASWRFHDEHPIRLPNDEARRPSDFLDAATRAMVDGPYDAMFVVTDAPVVSRRRKEVPGLTSPVSRVAVASSRRLVKSTRGEPLRELDDPTVVTNGATLLLHLFGHVLDLDHREDSVMAPFDFDPDRRDLPSFAPDRRPTLRAHAKRMSDEEELRRGVAGRLRLYASSLLTNPSRVGRSLVRNRAPLLPLSLPGLATAAVTPTLILVFSAEAWDVGIHLSDGVAALFAAVSIVAAATYLMSVHNLAFPRKERNVLTRHMALTNVVVYLTLVTAVAGLFLFVGALMLTIELLVFPQNLIQTWPSLEAPTVSLLDLVRTASFISTLGVVTGALAGGLESRTVVRHLALFLDRP
ncbi:hypothetical protein [Haloprofundus salilacus]|uniref:hypothetical protein n=1 Tax=Haloprofundus salilacus TaxID=2876190 RepID=UPI001CCFE35C|nr:hypothetical protein [Haloprofundus salilacus]